MGFWNWEIANQHVGVNVSILECAYLEITADYEVHIYVCDVMYHKLYILFSLASQKDHIVFFSGIAWHTQQLCGQQTHLAINHKCGQCLGFSNLKCLLIKKRKDYINLLHCSNSFKNSIEISHSLIRKNLHRVTAPVFCSPAPLLQSKHVVNEGTRTTSTAEH